MAGAAFAGAALGSFVAIHLPAAVYRPIILVALILVWLFIAFRRDFGMSAREVSRRRHLITAIVGGLVIGLVEQLSAAYVSSSFAPAIVFSILVAVLLLRPQGLLGRVTKEKV